MLEGEVFVFVFVCIVFSKYYKIFTKEWKTKQNLPQLQEPFSSGRATEE